MKVAELIVGSRRVRQFRTTADKRHLVEEARQVGVSVAAVAQAHGVNANQVFYWRKLYEAGQFENTPATPTGDLGICVRLLPVSVDDSPDWAAPILAASTAKHSVGSDVSPGSIELKLARGQVRIAGMVDAATLRAEEDRRDATLARAAEASRGLPAAIDRLVHHSVIVELNIPSYRMEEAKKNRDPAPESNEAISAWRGEKEVPTTIGNYGCR